jgi:outer membrane protein, multidrug efflux system
VNCSAAASCIAIGAIAIGVGGCRAVGPNYSGPPAAAVVNTPAARAGWVSASGPAFSQEAVPDAWWRLYDSAELDDLVKEALAANTDLREARANLERSAALLWETKAQRQPSVELNAAPSYQQLSAESYLHSGFVGPLGLYDLGLSASYDVDLFGRLRRAVEAASADDEAVKAAYDLTKVNVAAEVARAYADVCDAGEELAVARHSLRLQVESEGVTQRLVSAGRSPVIDLTRSSELVAQIRASLPNLEAERTNALYRLAALTGRPPAQYPRAVASCTSAPRLAGPIPVGDGAALLKRRPDVREAERGLAAATARIGVATADLYPDVTLGVSAGSTGALKDFLSRLTNRYGVGLGIRWEANRSVARARIAQANASAQLALARFDGVVLAALRDTESALTSYARDLERDEDLTAAQSRAREAEREADELYRAGKIDFLSLLEAQRTLDAAEDALARSHAGIATDQVRIFLTLGGGWQG